MTHFRFYNRLKSVSDANPWKRRAGLAWLALWLLIAGGFGYRHLSPEPVGEAQASSRSAVGPAPAGQELVRPEPDLHLPGRNRANTKPIEQIQVGERVAFAINPTEKLDESLSFDVNPRTWRKIRLKTSQHEVVLLRPVTWVDEHLAREGSTMMLVVAELGIDEPAEVVSIWPCPSISVGEGRIVLGTFTHIAPETICMYIDGQEEPIRCTPNHITWSVEHRDFVEAHELTAGSTVLCDDGVRKLARVQRIAEPIRVYNLEVQGQHVYQVSSLGMLVHNTCPYAGMSNNALNKTISAEQHVLLRELFKGRSGAGLTRSSLDAAAELSRRAVMNPATSTIQVGRHLERLQRIAAAIATL